MPKRILIIGGGAIGGVTAARLARSGHDVTVLDADREHVQRMRDPGLEVDLVGESHTVPLIAVSDVSELSGTYEFGLVTLKAPHIRTALKPLVEMQCVDLLGCNKLGARPCGSDNDRAIRFRRAQRSDV